MRSHCPTSLFGVGVDGAIAGAAWLDLGGAGWLGAVQKVLKVGLQHRVGVLSGYWRDN